MHTTTEEELIEHEHIQNNMLDIAKLLLESKKALQEEIRNDAKTPEFKDAVQKLKLLRKK